MLYREARVEPQLDPVDRMQDFKHPLLARQQFIVQLAQRQLPSRSAPFRPMPFAVLFAVARTPSMGSSWAKGFAWPARPRKWTD